MTEISDSTNIIGHLHHVEIYVSDLAKTTEFWGWFLEKLGYIYSFANSKIIY